MLLNLGIIGMTIAMLIAGYQQSFIERAVEGSDWAGYFAAQRDPVFVTSMWWRLWFGVMMTAGAVLLCWDFFAIGRGETRPATHEPETDPLGQHAFTTAEGTA